MTTSYQKEFQELVKLVETSLTEKFAVYNGSDTEGTEYDSIWEMWELEGVWMEDGRLRWYDKAHEYWENNEVAPATVNGMLGGFESISDLDLEGSKSFLESLHQSSGIGDYFDYEQDTWKIACCECGAGIGRVTKGLLLPLGFHRCQLVEPSARILEAAPDYIGEPDASKCRYICSTLQDFNPRANTFNLVWVQWVIIYLTDLDLVFFFQRVAKSLKPGGIIVIKENVCENQAFVVDRGDSSLSRSLPYLLSLLEQTNLKVIKKRMEDNFPEDLYPVVMIALGLDESDE